MKTFDGSPAPASAVQIRRAMATGKTTAQDAVEACLARIGAREEGVRAWRHVDAKGARSAAPTIDSWRDTRPLAGVPIAVKDIIDTHDMPTRYGSPIYADHRPSADAACVALLREAGAIVLGKTETTEFATSHPGPTRHPLNSAHTPGGSSSGSAAAVADGMVPLALGTQTMGSVIRPAAYCGVVGFKPSFGLVNRAGVKPQSESMDTIGWMGRSVEDVALTAGVLLGTEYAAIESRPLRVAFLDGPEDAAVEPAALAAMARFGKALSAQGCEVSRLVPPVFMAAALGAHLTIVLYDMARAFAFEWLVHRAQLSETLGQMIEQGRSISFEAYRAAQLTAAQARVAFAALFETCDLIVTPSALGEAPRGLASTGDTIMNRLWSLLHGPVATLPVGLGPAGLPLGAQIIGRPLRDGEFLAALRQLETAAAADARAATRL